MEWLEANWVWILVGVGFVWFMSRGHAGMGCCGRHPQDTHKDSTEQEGREKMIQKKF
jgi:hypothetical protein